jgi:type I restriction enzyme S subunit
MVRPVPDAPEQRARHEPASALLQRILAAQRQRWEKEGRRGKHEEPEVPDTKSLPKLPEGWVHMRLSAVLVPTGQGMKTGPFGTLLKKHEHQATGVPVLGIENIEPMRFVRESKIRITAAKAEQLSAYDAQPGDLLISRSGTVGEVCVVPFDLGPARLSTNVMRVQFLVESTLPEFFALLLNGSPFVLQQISDLCKGTTRTFLNQHILDSLVFPLPPLAEQRRILDEVYRLLSLQEATLQITFAAVGRCARLRQSILKWAFEGKLVDQDPSDEPASALLARIRGEQPTPAPRTTRKRGTR